MMARVNFSGMISIKSGLKSFLQSRHRQPPALCRETCNRAALLHDQESLASPSHSRRLMLLWSLIGITIINPPEGKAGLEKYVKRKKLDPLESYVPLVIQARELLGKVDLTDAKGSRQLLRSGPFYGIRTCIRSIGDYAAETDLSSSEASTLVSDVFSSLDNFDYFMRNPDEERVEAREKLNKVLLTLDRLLATVPPTVMEISRQIVEKVAEAQEGSPEDEGAEVDKALSSLLK